MGPKKDVAKPSKTAKGAKAGPGKKQPVKPAAAAKNPAKTATKSAPKKLHSVKSGRISKSKSSESCLLYSICRYQRGKLSWLGH